MGVLCIQGAKRDQDLKHSVESGKEVEDKIKRDARGILVSVMMEQKG